MGIRRIIALPITLSLIDSARQLGPKGCGGLLAVPAGGFEGKLGGDPTRARRAIYHNDARQYMLALQRAAGGDGDAEADAFKAGRAGGGAAALQGQPSPSTTSLVSIQFSPIFRKLPTAYRPVLIGRTQP